MALTKVSRGLLSTGIVDNSNATAITLNADESATFSGSVGIGVTNAADYYANNLVVGAGSEGGITIASSATTYNNYLAFADSSSGVARYAGLISYDHNINDMHFRTNSLERMRLSSDGQLSLATTENKARMTIGLTGVAVTGDTDGATMGENAIVHLLDSNSGAANSTVMLLGGGAGALGQIKSGIGFSRENASNWGTQLRFYTHSTATSDLDELKERIRIDAIGDVFIASAGVYPSASQTGFAYRGGAGGNGFIATGVGGTNGLTHHAFYNPNGVCGQIYTTGSGTVYVTSSDYRLKENVVGITGATQRLLQLKPSRFNFIADANITVDGFLAHEVADVVPEAIVGTKDAVDADGNPEYQGIDQSKLVPLLVATIQELEARLTALETP